MSFILDFRFWFSLIALALIACSTIFIGFLLRKKDSQSHLLPTLGFDALEPSLKAIYLKSTRWEIKLARFGTSCPELAREFRRTIFELQALYYPNPTSIADIRLLEQLIENEPQNEEAFLRLRQSLKQFRSKKKEPEGSVK